LGSAAEIWDPTNVKDASEHKKNEMKSAKKHSKGERNKSKNDLKRCFYCGDFVEKPKTCSACKFAVYCGKSCQQQHWKVHKSLCNT
jgi:hypothetical protein